MKPLLAAFVVVVLLSLGAFALTVPVVRCPLGYGTGASAGIDHQICKVCRQTGKLTLAESARLLVRQKGRWTWTRTYLCG
jgi:hypothetical protein